MNKRLCDYLKEQGACCKPSTVAGYRLILCGFYDHLKIKRIASLTNDDLRAYFLHLCARPLVPYTKVNYLLAVKKYLQWEVERDTISEDLLEVLDRKHFPKVPEYLPRPLSHETDRLLQERLRISTSPYAPLFLLLRHTGMRISELINLPPNCVMTTPKDENYLKVPLGKMNNERLVPLTEEALSWIKTITITTLRIHRQDKTRLINLPGSVACVYNLLGHRFEKLVGDMTDGNKPITFHRLRHTYATTLLTGGVGLVSLMKLLGHRRIEMTLRYAKVTPSHLRDEYLKAIRVLENQSVITNTKNSGEITGQWCPAELIRQISRFLNKTNATPRSQKKNLLLRLTRIEKELAKIPFPQKFIIRLPRENQTSRWAG